MNLLELCNLQGSLFLMILAGAVLKRRGIISKEGEKCLTDLCVNIVIPCNIVKSCLISFDASIFKTCGLLLAVGFVLQLVCVALNKVLFKGYSEQHRKVLQYCTIVSNGGFLGNPVAEGVYGSMGLLYASIFLIPMRVVMWSAGTSYFVGGGSDRKKVLKNVLTHPCLVGVYIGMFLMATQLQLPGVLKSTVTYIGNCTALKFSVLRLFLLPLLAYGISLAAGLDSVAAGVAVIMTGMPAGATAAIFAARYDSDAPFAAKTVVLTTLISMITIPAWCLFIG